MVESAEPKEDTMNDELMELLEDAVDRITYEHESLDNDSRCRCGAVNNMDGDALFNHRVGAMMEAIEAVLSQNMHEEQRTLADGEGGMSTNWRTGETTVHHKPCTRQSRWVTPWLTTPEASTPELSGRSVLSFLNEYQQGRLP